MFSDVFIVRNVFIPLLWVHIMFTNACLKILGIEFLVFVSYTMVPLKQIKESSCCASTLFR
jgi:hypothetical protein